MSQNLLVIIPCFNEYKRLNTKEYSVCLQRNKQVSILFVDDGSKDRTVEKFKELKEIFPDRVNFLLKNKNEGKAAAIYDGMTFAIKNIQCNYLGYIDADLSVSIDEITNLANILSSENKQFIFGSRWKRIGSRIERKITRHYIGRIFATISSIILDIGVYDTQCGAKIFTVDLAKKVFTQRFNVNWLFDVEIFFRLLQIFPKDKFDHYCLEYPLKYWKDVDGSKIKFIHGISTLKDFWILKNIYKQKR